MPADECQFQFILTVSGYSKFKLRQDARAVDWDGASGGAGFGLLVPKKRRSSLRWHPSPQPALACAAPSMRHRPCHSPSLHRAERWGRPGVILFAKTAFPTPPRPLMPDPNYPAPQHRLTVDDSTPKAPLPTGSLRWFAATARARNTLPPRSCSATSPRCRALCAITCCRVKRPRWMSLIGSPRSSTLSSAALIGPRHAGARINAAAPAFWWMGASAITVDRLGGGKGQGGDKRGQGGETLPWCFS